MEEIKNIENEIKKESLCCNETEPVKNAVSSPGLVERYRFLGVCIIVSSVIVGGSLIYNVNQSNSGRTVDLGLISEFEKVIFSEEKVVLPVVWGDLGKQMVDAGVIDAKKFEAIYSQRGGMDDASRKLLTGMNNGKLVITKDNANLLLNLLWALGLGNKNSILETGEMIDKKYGGDPGKFASTGGWTLSVGSPMDHYSHHGLVRLSPEQQALVDSVSRNIYRPCCGNSTHFPDCNHGMAMLGFLQLMAAQGVSEKDMYKYALVLSSYWFPDNYMTIARYYSEKRGVKWNKVDPKEVLGPGFSSSSGYQRVLSEVKPVQGQKGGSCGV